MFHNFKKECMFDLKEEGFVSHEIVCPLVSFSNVTDPEGGSPGE